MSSVEFKENVKMARIGFIGAGTVGTALAVILHSKGYHVAATSSRSRTSAANLAQAVTGCQVFDNGQEVADNTDLVFITTPDDVIASVAAQVKWHRGQSVFHCSGSASTDILEPARKIGAQVGAFHPLQTLASTKQAIENIPGSTFAIEAEEPLFGILKEMAVTLDGDWIRLKASDKVLYHASAVIACNYLVTLVKLAADLWQTFDVPREQAVKALMPLLRGTLHNIETVGIPKCLTGPIARGDTGTVRSHIEAFEQKAPGLLSIYRELGRQTIPVALAKGRINEEQARGVLNVLGESKPEPLLVRRKHDENDV